MIEAAPATACELLASLHARAFPKPWSASEIAKLLGHELPTRLPDLDLAKHAEALVLLRDAVRSGAIQFARDVSEGGLATTLAECSLGGVGATVDVAPLIERLRREHPDAQPMQVAKTA